MWWRLIGYFYIFKNRFTDPFSINTTYSNRGNYYCTAVLRITYTALAGTLHALCYVGKTSKYTAANSLDPRIPTPNNTKGLSTFWVQYCRCTPTSSTNISLQGKGSALLWAWRMRPSPKQYSRQNARHEELFLLSREKLHHVIRPTSAKG